MPTAKGVLQKYREGQNIFGREAVACLVARIEQLEKYIASQQNAHLTGLESRPFCTTHEIYYDAELGCPACPAPQVA